MRSGVVMAVPLHGTRMLHVHTGRIHYTWYSDGNPVSARVRLDGRYLNPRWIEVPSWYDLTIEQIYLLPEEEQLARGLVRSYGKWQLLIYQQLGDITSLQRQLADHVLDQVDRTETRLWTAEVNQIELRRSVGVGDGMHADPVADAIEGQIERARGRKSHMKVRLTAVNERIRFLQNRIVHVRGLVKMHLAMINAVLPGESLPHGTIIGIYGALTARVQELGVFRHERELWPQICWATYHLQVAQRRLMDADLLCVQGHLLQAIGHLQWPEEELE